MDNSEETSAHIKYGKTGAQLLSYSFLFSVLDFMINLLKILLKNQFIHKKKL